MRIQLRRSDSDGGLPLRFLDAIGYEKRPDSDGDTFIYADTIDRTYFCTEVRTDGPVTIDCSTNYGLFCALCVQSRETDMYNLFVTDADCHWYTLGTYMCKGDFTVSLVDKQPYDQFSSTLQPQHKASTDEIIKYFSDKKWDWTLDSIIEHCSERKRDYCPET